MEAVRIYVAKSPGGKYLISHCPTGEDLVEDHFVGVETAYYRLSRDKPHLLKEKPFVFDLPAQEMRAVHDMHNTLAGTLGADDGSN